MYTVEIMFSGSPSVRNRTVEKYSSLGVAERIFNLYVSTAKDFEEQSEEFSCDILLTDPNNKVIERYTTSIL